MAGLSRSTRELIESRILNVLQTSSYPLTSQEIILYLKKNKSSLYGRNTSLSRRRISQILRIMENKGDITKSSKKEHGQLYTWKVTD